CTVSLGHSRSPIHGKSRRCRLGHVISCVQSQLITCKQGNAGYQHFSPLELSEERRANHQGTDDQCALMICVAPAAQPVSVHQCHISSTFQCSSVPHQCHISVPI
ncbi:unnamed protein product, partial [Staurois parvus]